MRFWDIVLGRPLSSKEEEGQKVGVIAGVPMLGLDALSSAAYGPEAAMTLLIPIGGAGLAYIGPITAVIVTILLIVFLSYLQTIGAYPAGGGSFTVARRNLGAFPGLLAAAALMLDYVLVVAVGISAGVGALVSAVPQWQPHTLALCLGILFFITIVNLRGVRESGLAFVVPTYGFVVCMFSVLGIGLARLACGRAAVIRFRQFSLPTYPSPRATPASGCCSAPLRLGVPR
jgi:amino acid transporter